MVLEQVHHLRPEIPGMASIRRRPFDRIDTDMATIDGCDIPCCALQNGDADPVDHEPFSVVFGISPETLRRTIDIPIAAEIFGAFHNRLILKDFLKKILDLRIDRRSMVVGIDISA